MIIEENQDDEIDKQEDKEIKDNNETNFESGSALLGFTVLTLSSVGIVKVRKNYKKKH